MLRMAGAILLSGGAALMGLCAVRYMDVRVHHLRMVIHGLETILREMDYRLAPLPELLSLAAKETESNSAEFFAMCAKGAEHLNGRSFQEVWEQAAEASELRLEQEDLELLEQLGGILGRYDRENQRQALEKAMDRLGKQCGKAVEQRGNLGRVYTVLGLTAGAFFVILLI